MDENLQEADESVILMASGGTKKAPISFLDYKTMLDDFLPDFPEESKQDCTKVFSALIKEKPCIGNIIEVSDLKLSRSGMLVAKVRLKEKKDSRFNSQKPFTFILLDVVRIVSEYDMLTVRLNSNWTLRKRISMLFQSDLVQSFLQDPEDVFVTTYYNVIAQLMFTFDLVRHIHEFNTEERSQNGPRPNALPYSLIYVDNKGSEFIVEDIQKEQYEDSIVPTLVITIYEHDMVTITEGVAHVLCLHPTTFKVIEYDSILGL